MEEDTSSFIHEVKSGIEFDKARRILEKDHQTTLSRLRILTENHESDPEITIFTSQIRIGRELTSKEMETIAQYMTRDLISNYGALSVESIPLLENMGTVNLSALYPIVEIPFTPYNQKWMTEQQKTRLSQMQERINTLASVSLSINLQSKDKTSPTILGAKTKELIIEDNADYTIEIFSLPSFSNKREEYLAMNITSSFLSAPPIDQKRRQIKLTNNVSSPNSTTIPKIES